LQPDAADLGSATARVPGIDRRKGEKAARLIGVTAPPGQFSQLHSRKILAQLHR